MDKFIWTPEYSVGVQLIDEQHQHFFSIANRLLGLAQEEQPTRAQLTDLFGELGDYALYHLSTEESFFREFDYEDTQAHVAAHDAYRKMVAEHFTSELGKPEVDLKHLAAEMANYSGTWLQEHILGMDKKYTEVFNRHGFK